MENLIYFFIALGIMFIFFIIDGISHQKFNKKTSIIFHVVGILILLISMSILIIKEFKMSFFLYPGILIMIIGLFIAYKGFVKIKPHLLKAEGVFKKGIYSKIRHPIYLGLIIALLGLSLFVYSLTFLIYAIATILMFFWLAKYEDKHLTKRFGKEYIKYKKDVPMLFPFRINKNKVEIS